MSLIYRPNHPMANQNGLVDRDLVCEEKHGSAPYIISDAMDTTWHPATGKRHTSKAAFRADTRASGCIEVGNDSSLTKSRKPVQMDRAKRRDDIRRSLYELRNGIKRPD